MNSLIVQNPYAMLSWYIKHCQIVKAHLKMKKPRGLKKYYQRLETENDLKKLTWFDLEDPNAWFDYWHLHFDWNGLGNNSFKKRKPHLDKLFRHFQLLEEETKKLKKDFQLFAVLQDYKSEYDALYFHTRNPNKDNFPIKYNSLKQESTFTNQDLDAYLKKLTDYEKFYGSAEENYCVLFKKGLGIEPN
ncbi:hypothetical protein [Croceimicrobium hydrocarbonivorans]|uniref:Uncharacterized protein n=1 Tax=Croceimicrobium hydrocarbonivorans TaxID=2761580 RepID=A0A7H0VHE0_9FLAO|nr:hypothetical protein [Croceimicrobium hydrocarbonivorans]QNR25138.1 hypothetical protein H4K34_04685 [Croceimicrobium hydrocarbonivorans]